MKAPMSPRQKKQKKLTRPPLRRLTPNDLKAWRLKHDLTQQELAWLLGVRHSTISRWENGKHSIPNYLFFLLSCLEEKVLMQSN